MRTVYLIGPREPSGLSWLYNCLLCLDIKVHYVHPRNNGEMWKLSNGKYTLNPVDDLQKKWAPILSKKESFSFRDDIQIQFDHIWPTGWQRGQKVVFFVRNPYDALYSRWKRDAQNISFLDFLNVPDHITLLNKIDSWHLFCEVWLAQREFLHWHLVRFEDYKTDAEKTLRQVLEFLELDYSDEAITFALTESSFEQAKLAEQAYEPILPTWLQVCDDVFPIYSKRKINRSGSNIVDQTPNEFERQYVIERAAAVCSELGYCNLQNNPATTYLPQQAMLSFYRHLDMPEEWFQDGEKFDFSIYINDLNNFFEYIRNPSYLLRTLENGGLIFGEVAALIAALQEMQGCYIKLAKQD